MLLLLLAMLASASPVVPQAASVRKISVHGNKKLTTRKLLDGFQTRARAPFDRQLWDNDVMRVLVSYQAVHYYLATVDSTAEVYSMDSAFVDLHLFLTENRPVEVGTVRLTGMATLNEEGLRELMNLSEGRVFDPGVLESDLDRILEAYENVGRPFARLVVRRATLLEDDGRPRIDLDVAVSEGPAAWVREIEITGNRTTRSDVLAREMRLVLPGWYRQDRVDDGINRLKRLPFLDDVREPQIVFYGDSSYGLRVDVQEGEANRIDGIAGYVPKRPNTDERGYFTGLIHLSFQNLFGTARTLDVRWQKRTRYTQEFVLAYMEPWVLGYPVHAGGSLKQLVQDTIYVERQFSLDGSVWIGTLWQVLWGGRRKTVDPAGDVNGFLFNIPSARFLSVYAGVSYDTRDDRLNPRRGVFYRASVEYGRKDESFFSENPDGPDTLYIASVPRIGRSVDQRIATQRLLMDLEYLYPLTRTLVLFDACHAGVYKSPQAVVPYSEHFIFGGLNSVRGYNQDILNGTRVGWNNFEVRWLTSRASRLFVFLDVGYYFRKNYGPDDRTRIVREDGWPVGYGFGIRYRTRLGLFALDYGLGKDDSFSNGKVHFGITGQF